MNKIRKTNRIVSSHRGNHEAPKFACSGIFLLFAIIALSGCVVGPDYVPPEPDMPNSWSEAGDPSLAPKLEDLGDWWQKFNDPILDSIVARAQENNQDLALAIARVMEARARYGIARSERLPNLVGSGGYSRARMSETILGRDLDNDDIFSVGFDSSWEIDVFGRISRSIEAARADIEVSEEDYNDVMVSLNAEVAISYVQLRSFQARLSLARANVTTQNESLKIAQTRFDTELAPELDVFQARTNLASTESQIPDFESGIVFSINRLAVLLGVFPQALRSELLPQGPIPTAPLEVSTGAPADLVRRRPDIRRAERQLARQTALIGVATADLYPRFTLSGFFDLQSDHLADWVKGKSIAWSLGPAFQWNLFQGGAIRANINVAEEQAQQSLHIYQNTLLLAVEEVENAVAAFSNEKKRYAALGRATYASGKTVELSTELYRRGLSDYQNVLDANRSKLLNDLDKAASEGEAIIALIRLYRALGGGWSMPQPTLDETPEE
ncbi:MAG: multidrug efflux system outer membrane protein [Planctomycetota bacterium]|jgi:multidrug efflux system outer membrane protein